MNDPLENSEQLQEEIVSPQRKDNPPKKKLCIFTKLQIAFVLAIIAMIFLEKISPENDLPLYIAGSLLIVIPFLAIISLVRISLYSDQLKGRIICFLVLAASCFFIYNAFLSEVPRAKKYRFRQHRIMIGPNFIGLGVALSIYANDYDGRLPSDNWCDRLMEEADVSPKNFYSGNTDFVDGESDYCLNKHVAGQDISSFPAKTVLLFVAVFEPAENEKRQPIKNRKSFFEFEMMQEIFTGDEKVYLNRWNRVGGPELLKISRYDEGCYILFVDGTVEYVRYPELSKLRWDLAGTVKIDTSRLEPMQSPRVFAYSKNLQKILALVGLCLTVFVVFKYGTAKRWEFIILTGILSAATGAFFGNMSEKAYISFGQTGLHAGGYYGLLVGLCYAVLMVHWLKKLYPLKTIVGFASSVGMVTGIVCATLVHIVLIIVNEETNFFGIIIGIPYGIFAGAILGAISGLILKKTYKPQLVNESSVEGVNE